MYFVVWVGGEDAVEVELAKDLNGRRYVNVESDLYTSGRSGYGNVAAENGKQLNVNGVGRRLFMRPKKYHYFKKSECHANSSAFGMGDSLPSRNGVPSKEKHNLHLAKRENTESKSQQDIIDLSKQSGSACVFVKAPTVGVQDFGQDEQFKLGSIKSHGEKDSAIDAQLGTRKDGSASLVNSPRVIGQKRLVRNGCISPHNIAKAKKPAGMEDHSVFIHGPTDTSLTASSAGTSSDGTKEMISKDAISTVKGKGVVIHSSPSKERDTTHTSSRTEGILPDLNATKLMDIVIAPNTAFQRVGRGSSRNQDARASQVEADERLHGTPRTVIDEDVALALMQEDLLRAPSGSQNQLSGHNGSSVTNLQKAIKKCIQHIS
ncbi:hypothetical protein HAX54_043507 [Datura stramonium]|uniref:Uncharacterized protein n=1 Tax=Datura stramonium TaxID=4076 RepID=A0ABS8SPK2_DATST|nr:hypothetical protein [Datura stramonium]